MRSSCWFIHPFSPQTGRVAAHYIHNTQPGWTSPEEGDKVLDVDVDSFLTHLDFQALNHGNAANETNLPDHKAIERSTYGILFLGTPHLGGNHIELLSAIKKLQFSKGDGSILKELKLGSHALVELQEEYKSISAKYVTTYCYEMLPTKIAGINTVVCVHV